MLKMDVGSIIALDVSTLLVVAACVILLLGLFLFLAWKQDGIRALGWWGAGYLLGGFAIALWALEGSAGAILPDGPPTAMLLVACAMMWSAARLFHGRNVLWAAMLVGATAWLLALQLPDFDQSAGERIALISLITSTYMFLTAFELCRERRKFLILRRRPVIFAPVLHGTAFLLPIPLAIWLCQEQGTS